MEPMKLYLMGGLSVRAGGAEIDQFPTKRSAMILARLALSRNGSISRDELAEELWPEDYLDTTRLRLRQELKRLRGALGPAKDIIDADRQWVRLDLAQVEVDSRELDRTHHLAEHATDLERRGELAGRLAEFYRGPLLPEFSEPWAISARLDAKSKLESTLSKLALNLFELGNHQGARDWSQRLLSIFPSNLGAAMSLARAERAMGRVREAISSLEAFESISGPNVEVAQLKKELREAAPDASTALPHIETAPRSLQVKVCEELPAYFDSFVGREEEIGLVWELLQPGGSARLASVVGPGGVGKTRLSAEVGGRAAAVGVPVVFISLEGLKDGLWERIADGIARDRECLLILDNTESNIDEAANCTGKALRSYPRLKILATSRQRMAIAGERVIELAPIPTPLFPTEPEKLMENPAVSLFVERARDHDPQFKVTEDQCAPLVALLQRLDGLPLAIELAAAKVGTLGIHEMARDLDDLYTSLVTRRRDIPARQRSMLATIDWSYESLEAGLRESLAAAAAAVGGFNLQVAELVLGDGAAELLDDLHGRSLISVSRNPTGIRYRVLDSIRAYVELKTSEVDRMCHKRKFAYALSEYLTPFWNKIGGVDEASTFEAIGLESTNLLSAMDWATLNDPELAVRLGANGWKYWCLVAHRREGYRALCHVLDSPSACRNQHRASALFGAGYTAYSMGRTAEAKSWFEQSAAAYEVDGIVSGAVWAKTNLACVFAEEGDFQTAHRMGMEVLKEFEETNSEYGQALANADLAIVLASMGRHEEAAEKLTKSTALRSQLNSPVEMARAIYDKGRLAYERSELELAMRLFRDARSGFEGLGHASLSLDATRSLADTLSDSEKWEEAVAEAAYGERTSAQIGGMHDPTWPDRIRAGADLHLGELESARRRTIAILQDALREEQVNAIVDAMILAVAVLARVVDQNCASEIRDQLLASLEGMGYCITPARRRRLEKLKSKSKAVEGVLLRDVAGRALGALL